MVDHPFSGLIAQAREFGYDETFFAEQLMLFKAKDQQVHHLSQKLPCAVSALGSAAVALSEIAQYSICASCVVREARPTYGDGIPGLHVDEVNSQILHLLALPSQVSELDSEIRALEGRVDTGAVGTEVFRLVLRLKAFLAPTMYMAHRSYPEIIGSTAAYRLGDWCRAAQLFVDRVQPLDAYRAHVLATVVRTGTLDACDLDRTVIVAGIVAAPTLQVPPPLQVAFDAHCVARGPRRYVLVTPRFLIDEMVHQSSNCRWRLRVAPLEKIPPDPEAQRHFFEVLETLWCTTDGVESLADAIDAAKGVLTTVHL